VGASKRISGAEELLLQVNLMTFDLDEASIAVLENNGPRLKKPTSYSLEARRTEGTLSLLDSIKNRFI